VLEIAQGRVWSGSRAVELGLVDANGGIIDAIIVAAHRANISYNYGVVEVLEEGSALSQLLQTVGSQSKAAVVDKNLEEAAELYNSIKRECDREGVQAYCPYTFGIN
jgi:protease-4